jgi:hypothetical protein
VLVSITESGCTRWETLPKDSKFRLQLKLYSGLWTTNGNTGSVPFHNRKKLLQNFVRKYAKIDFK